MANYTTIARPYAKAIFQQAVADDRLEQWSLVLRGLALITKEAQLVQLYGDPSVTSDVMVELIYDTLMAAAQDAVTGLSDKLKNFLSLLLEEKRLIAAADISTLYHKFVAEYKKVIEVEVVSAMTLSDEQRKAFHDSLEKRFASKVSIEFQQDESLIGGALVRSGNWVLDGSIRGKVSRLSEVFMSFKG